MTAMSNPPQLEYSPAGRSAGARWARRLAVLLAFFPLLLLASVYGGWLAAWAAIGHRPDSVLDDPASLGPLVNAAIMPAQLLVPAAWLVFVIHVAAVGAVFYPSLAPGGPRRRKFAVLAAAVAPWAAAFLLLNADPGQVIKWAQLTPP
jgi:hypothetical protein